MVLKKAAKKRGTSQAALVKRLGGRIAKKFGDDSVRSIEEASSNIKEWYSTTVPPLDLIISGKIGQGFPSNRVCEIFGPESIGKTSIGGTLMRIVQQREGLGVFIDSESTFDNERRIALGVDSSKLLYLDLDSVEDTIDAILDLIEGAKGSRMLIFWDTLAATMARGEEGRRIGEAGLGIHARIMSQAMRKLTKPLARSCTALIICNQRKEGAIGVPFATERDKNKTLGGSAMDFHAHNRLFIQFSRKLVRTVGKNTVNLGFETRAQLIKNKSGKSYIQVRLVFVEEAGGRYDAGLSCLRTLQHWKVISSGNKAITFAGKKHSFMGWKKRYDSDEAFRKTVHIKLEECYAEQTKENVEDVG